MKRICKFLRFISIATLPLLIILTAIRVALLPVFVTIEYQMPSFPPDPYGFTTADRLEWSKYSIDYLLGKISDEEISSQSLEDGSALFNKREMKHMQDVRDLTQIVLVVWRCLIILLIAVLIMSLQLNDLDTMGFAYRRGVVTTFLIIAIILVFVALNFNLIFTKFHEVFFEGGTWLFYMSDNLIRLFPLQFWRDIFIFIGITSVLFGAAIYTLPSFFFSKKARR